MSGAVAALSLDGRALWAAPLPTRLDGGKAGRRELHAPELARWLRRSREDGLCWTIVLGVVERVASRPGQGVAGVFGFGRTSGLIEGVLAGLEIPVRRPTPQEWRREVLPGAAAGKEAAILFARKRFPSIELVLRGCRKPHDGMADALAIAEFGRRLLAGEAAA